MWLAVQDGTTALSTAAQSGHVEVVKALLGAGADLEATDMVSGACHRCRAAVCEACYPRGAGGGRNCVSAHVCVRVCVHENPYIITVLGVVNSLCV